MLYLSKCWNYIKGGEKLNRYIIVDEAGVCCGNALSQNEIKDKAYILVDRNFSPENKRWNGKEWEEYIPEPQPELPTELEQMEADIAYLKMIRLSK